MQSKKNYTKYISNYIQLRANDPRPPLPPTWRFCYWLHWQLWTVILWTGPKFIPLLERNKSSDNLSILRYMWYPVNIIQVNVLYWQLLMCHTYCRYITAHNRIMMSFLELMRLVKNYPAFSLSVKLYQESCCDIRRHHPLTPQPTPCYSYNTVMVTFISPKWLAF